MEHDEKPPQISPLAPTVLDRPNTGKTEPSAGSAMAGAGAASALSDRYEVRGLLGVGGMGEVHLVYDRRIGREVALKTLRESEGRAELRAARFLREARIQGQLEHPSLVPVHDLSVDPGGAVYFTMPRVRGATLASVLAQLSAGDAEHAQRFTLRRLLTAFSRVCLAVDFAHQRGVVHRDLKPENIMLGEHGQVQLLDWGVARTVSEAYEGTDTPPPQVDTEPDPSPLATVAGSVVGTPGYMAPEQAAGELEEVGPRSDVYSLGAILFEILAGARLHEGATPIQRLHSTLRGADARASLRAPSREVPPELEALCVEATRDAPEERLASARELSDRIERYLEGDRDVQRRRELAAEHAERARGLALEAEGTGPAAALARTAALREVARALAFDPEHRPALATLVHLLAHEPREVPPEVAAQLAANVQADRRRGAALGLLSSAIWLALIPFGLAMGVRDWAFSGAIIGLVIASVVASAWVWRLPQISGAQALSLLTLHLVAIATFSGIFGPFLLVPGVALTQVVFFNLTGGVLGRRWLLALMATATIAVPWLLELAGALPPSMRFTDAGLLITPRGLDFPPTLTTVYLLATTLGLVPVSIFLADRVRALLAAAERRNALQMWQLRQMVPDEGQSKP